MQGASLLRHFDMDNALGWLTSACVFLFPILVLTVNHADSAILLLLGGIGCYVVGRHGVMKLSLSRQETCLLLVFLCWYAIVVLCYFAGDKTDTGFKLLGRNLRLLFFLPAFIACRRYLRDPRLLWMGLALAPFGALLYGFWQFVLASGNIRTSGAVEAIPFGDLSLDMGFMALASLYVIERPRRAWQIAVAAAALIAGMLTSILSGTRGGWIALPILSLVTILVLSENSKRRGIKISLLWGLLVLFALILSPGALVKNRVDDVVSNLSKYRGYLNLIEKGDITRRGCLNEKLFLDNLARQLSNLHIPNLDVAVVNDGRNLVLAGVRAECQSGYVIRVTNENQADNLMFRMQRAVPNPQGIQTAQFIVRGKGRVTVIYGKGKDVEWTYFDNTNYRGVEHTQDIKELSWPDFWIPAGSSVYFVPKQNYAGEYVFPFVSNSIGERLEMWRAAWHIFKQHPMMGAGTGSFLEEVDNRVRTGGDVFLQIITYDHPHNDYLNALSSQGLLGLALYMLSMGYPLVLYVGALRSENRIKKAAGFSGIILVSGLLVFGLTETMFTHSIVMSWYVTFTAMFMAILFRSMSSETRAAGHS